jgi:hypothetical protein
MIEELFVGPDVTNKDGGINCIGVLFFIGLFIAGAVWLFAGHWRTEYKNPKHIEAIVKQRCKAGVVSTGKIGSTDLWDNQLKAGYRETKYKKIYTVISAGDDEEFGTSDDQYAEHTDHNKTRIVGKFVGNTTKKLAGKTKEFLGGLKDSVFGDKK